MLARLLLLAAVLCLGLAAPAVAAPAPPSATRRVPDLQLYQLIDERVGRGENYYRAAASLHREHSMPLKPFVAVRLPTLAWIVGALGFVPALVLAVALSMLTSAMWFGAVRFARPVEQICVVFLVAGACVMPLQAVYLHEWWAGILVSLGLALALRGAVAASTLAVLAAALIREFSILFAVAALAPLVWRRRWRAAALLAAAIGAYAGLLLVHKASVGAVTFPGDSVSPGWFGFQGFAGIASDMNTFLLLDLFGSGWVPVLTVLPLLGWGEVARRQSVLPLLWFGGFFVVIAVVARQDNLFWGRMVLPAYTAGLAFVPRALLFLARSGLRRFERSHPARSLSVVRGAGPGEK